MNLLADEGIDKPIVDALRNAGFNVAYILETNAGAGDDFILSLANTEKRILITQDKDFGELVFRLKQVHYGVILIRLHGYPTTLKAKITTSVLTEHKNELTQAFTVIQPNAIRIRK
jgi:predicted nuclease of predicted toxin-antitoxin system